MESLIRSEPVSKIPDREIEGPGDREIPGTWEGDPAVTGGRPLPDEGALRGASVARRGLSAPAPAAPEPWQPHVAYTSIYCQAVSPAGGQRCIQRSGHDALCRSRAGDEWCGVHRTAVKHAGCWTSRLLASPDPLDELEGYCEGITPECASHDYGRYSRLCWCAGCMKPNQTARHMAWCRECQASKRDREAEYAR